jgi:hypothetical protein
MFSSKVERSAFARVNLRVWPEKPGNGISCWNRLRTKEKHTHWRIPTTPCLVWLSRLNASLACIVNLILPKDECLTTLEYYNTALSTIRCHQSAYHYPFRSQRRAVNQEINKWIFLSDVLVSLSLCWENQPLNRRWPPCTNMVLRNSYNTWKFSRTAPGEFPIPQYNLSIQ